MVDGSVKGAKEKEAHAIQAEIKSKKSSSTAKVRKGHAVTKAEQ